MEALLVIELEDDKPYKACRLYDKNGKALGYGKVKLVDNKQVSELDLFTNSSIRNITYSLDINEKVIVDKYMIEKEEKQYA